MRMRRSDGFRFTVPRRESICAASEHTRQSLENST